MEMAQIRRILAVSAGCLSLLAVAPAVASAAPEIATVQFTPAERAASLQAWTPERMKKIGADHDLGPTGPMTHTWSGVAMKTVGRLFFVHSDVGEDSYCTATSVKSGNRDVVLTAGHCVWKPGAPAFPYFDMVFVPGYDKGERPYGVFPVRALLTPKDHTTDGKHDVAAVVVDPVNGQHVNDVVGAQSVSFDQQVGKQVTSFGYPDTRPQLGEELLYCAGKTEVDPTAIDPQGDPQQRVSCDMNAGSSGGPWISGLDPATGLGTVVSVNSSLDSFQPKFMGGPLFGAETKELLRQAGQS